MLGGTGSLDYNSHGNWDCIVVYTDGDMRRPQLMSLVCASADANWIAEQKRELSVLPRSRIDMSYSLNSIKGG